MVNSDFAAPEKNARIITECRIIEGIKKNIGMLTTSTHFYLLTESANPASILHDSSAEAAILAITGPISARSGEGFATSFAAQLQCPSISNTLL